MTTGGFRRIGRHRDHPGVQAPEERRDVVRAAGKQQYRAIAEFGVGLQSRSNGARTKVQVPVTEDHALILLFGEKAQRHLIRCQDCPALKGLGQGAGEFERVRHGVSCQDCACNGERALLSHNFNNYL